MPDRGASEVLGFVLVASLIFATLGTVYVAGIGGLEDARDAERVQNAERAFGVLADNLADIRTQGAPSRATEIKLAEAQLSYGSSTTLSVKVTNSNTNPSFSTDLNPIVYSAGTGSEIVYEAGGLFRVDHDSAVLKRNPPLVLRADGDEETVLFPYVQTRRALGAPTNVGGTTTTLVRAERADREVLADMTTPGADGASELDSDGRAEYAVTYMVVTTPARAVPWVTHLNDMIPDTFDNNDLDGDGNPANDPACVRSGDTVTCLLQVEKLYVTATRINVAFS